MSEETCKCGCNSPVVSDDACAGECGCSGDERPESSETTGATA